MQMKADNHPMRHGQVVRLCAAGAALLIGLITLFVPVSGFGLDTSYAAVSPVAHTAFLIAGMSLLIAGAVAAADPATGALGLLGTAAGVAWLAPIWTGWEHGPPAVRSVSMVLAWFLPPVLLHFALAAPFGRLVGTRRRAAVMMGYLVTAIAAIGTAITRDPFLDPNCWANCTDNIFLAASHPAAAEWFRAVWLWAAMIGGALAAVVAITGIRTATPVVRATGWVLLIAVCLANLAELTYSAALIRLPSENLSSAVLLAIFYFRSASLMLIALGVLKVLIDKRRRRAAIAALADELAAGPAVGALQASLSRSLGDASLTVAYWQPDSGRYVDSAGRRLDPDQGADRARTSIVRGGAPVAVITHDHALYDDQELAEQFGPAARLAIDNERLMAQVLAQLEALRAARGRIVQTADDTRRRIERDLQDGAQQRLLAVTFELRLARSATTDQASLDGIDTAIAQATSALAELRDLAHGIFPVILEECGLAPAVWSLIERTDALVEVIELVEERLPYAVERAAYVVVVEVLSAMEPGDEAALAIRRADGALIIDIDGVAMPMAIHLQDRVGAIGGTITFAAQHVRAELPCAY